MDSIRQIKEYYIVIRKNDFCLTLTQLVSSTTLVWIPLLLCQWNVLNSFHLLLCGDSILQQCNNYFHVRAHWLLNALNRKYVNQNFIYKIKLTGGNQTFSASWTVAWQKRYSYKNPIHGPSKGKDMARLEYIAHMKPIGFTMFRTYFIIATHYKMTYENIWTVRSSYIVDFPGLFQLCEYYCRILCQPLLLVQKKGSCVEVCSLIYFLSFVFPQRRFICCPYRGLGIRPINTQHLFAHQAFLTS